MYPQFKRKEARPTEKYAGRSVGIFGGKVEVAGYRGNEYAYPPIVGASETGGRYGEFLDPQDVVAKKCERYRYAGINDLIDWKIMAGNKDFASLYAGRAAFGKNGGHAGAAAGRNDMHGVISGVGHVNGRQSRGADDTGVPEEGFTSYEYRNAGTPAEPDAPHGPVDPGPGTTGGLIGEHGGVRGIQFPTDGHGNVQAAYIRGRHGGMKPVGTGDGLENVSSRIREEKVWRH